MRRRIFLLLLAALATSVFAQEKVTLTTPVAPARPAISDLRVTEVYMGLRAQRITVELTPVDGSGNLLWDLPGLTFQYHGEEAVTFMTALNKANLSTKSLHKRIMERLQADGKLGAGAISGTP